MAAHAPLVLPWNLPTPDSLTQSAVYRQTLREIYAYSERRPGPAAVALGRARKLDRMRALLLLLGRPQDRFQTILVAGTKGKGSMAAILASVLKAAGHRVGRYTQPHLYSYRERTWVDGEYTTEQDVVDRFDDMRVALEVVEAQARDLGPLTTFDVGAAQTLLHFANAGVELAVVEVGVGGTNDATNVLEPILALIGPIGLDHTATLGPSIPDIARHKAGIMRRGLDVVVGSQLPEAARVLHEVAASLDARLHELGRDIVWTGEPCGRFAVAGAGVHLDGLECPLQGPCQRDNAAVALMAAALLSSRGWDVTAQAMREGLARVSWPGRFQIVMRDPLTVVDGAHNQSAAQALRASLEDCFPHRPVTLVLGMSVEKDAVAFIDELAPCVREVVATRARHERASDPHRLAAAARGAGLDVSVAQTPGEAVRRAWSSVGPDGLVLVAGSIFLAGDVLEWLQFPEGEAV